MNICILTTATRDYIQFVPELYQSIERYFLNGHRISYLLFTDHDTFNAPVDNVRLHKIAHEPWPMMTLKRYHFHLLERVFIQKHDYAFYFDVDMLICDTVGDEILRDSVGASHPHLNFHFHLPVNFTFERSPRSLAYIPQAMSPLYYCCGGVQGGTSKRYLKMAEALARAIDDDLARGVIARWHDESHFNKYLRDHPPSLILPVGFVAVPKGNKIFSPRISKMLVLLVQFAMWLNKDQTSFTKIAVKLVKGIIYYLRKYRFTDTQPKIIALDKDHAAIRAEPPHNETQ